MGSAFVLGHPFGVFAALRGRELGYPDLSVPSTHGQGGVSTVGEELGLNVKEEKWVSDSVTVSS